MNPNDVIDRAAESLAAMIDEWHHSSPAKSLPASIIAKRLRRFVSTTGEDENPRNWADWTVSATKSDGRTWLHLKRSDGASAALSCQTSHDSGETIASQVVTEFAAALNEAADALEGGVAVTDEMVRAASMRLITALPNEAVGAIHKADYSLDDIAAAVVRSALSAPAQRVEEGRELTDDETAMLDNAWRRTRVMDDDPFEGPRFVETGEAKRLKLRAASPAPAPHAGVDVKALVELANELSWSKHTRETSNRIRAALEDRT